MTLPRSGSRNPVAPIIDTLIAGFANDSQDFIAEDVLPAVDTRGLDTGRFFEWGAQAFFGDPDKTHLRAPGANYDRHPGSDITNTQFTCLEYGLEIALDDESLDSSDPVLRAELKASELFMIDQALRIRQELRTMTLLTTTGNWTNSTTLAGNAQWSASASNPVGDINTAVDTVRSYGPRASVAVCGYATARDLTENVSILSYLGHHQDRNQMSFPELKAFFASHWGLTLHIGQASRSTGSLAPGGAATMADIWPDSMFIGRISTMAIPTSGGMRLQPTAAVRAVRTPMTREEYRDEGVRGLVMRQRHKEDELVFQAEMGYVIADTAA